MSELKLISPLLDGMEIEKCIQSGGGISVYLLRHVETGQPYILKHISVPESQTQVDALLFTGAASNVEEAQTYFEQVVDDYRVEFDALDTLRGSTNFATYRDYQVIPKDDGIGFEIYLLSEKWKSLSTYLGENAMTHLKALNLGLDLCSALCDLRAQGLIHRDIKPENIYLNGLGGFMLGDLGLARITHLKYCAMPDRMITEYTAPELSDLLNPFNTTVDIYSVGMVLYRILNGNHGPFVDEKTSTKAANKLRISGEPLPAPLYADYELTEIILKACAFEPTDRYQTPEELMQDLVLYMKRNSVTDSLIVPPIVTDPDIIVSPESLDEEIEPVRFADVEQMDQEFVSSFSPDTQSINTIIAEVRREEKSETAPPSEEGACGEIPPPEVPSPAFAAPLGSPILEDEEETSAPASPSPGKSKKPKKLWILLAAAVVFVGAAAVSIYFLVFGGPPLHINGINLVEKGTDFITVSLDTRSKDAALQLQCGDAYGNVQTAAYTGEDITFSNLASGAQYTITVLPEGNQKLSGATSTMVTTTATTEIVSFTAASDLAGQVELKLTVSGPKPETWTVRYYADGVAPQDVQFSGNSVSIFNLETNLQYTFELVPPEGIVLSGSSTLEFTSGPEVEILDLKAASLTKTSVVVTWDCGEHDPGAWSVTCTGTDGSTKTQTVQDKTAEFTELMTGETYTITVTSAGTLSPSSITVTPTAATITSVETSVLEDGGIHVAWSSDTESSTWQVLYTVQDTALTAWTTVEGSEITLTGLIPGETYEIEIESAAGEKLSGNPTAEATVPEAGKFASYGATRFFLGTFLRPAKDSWTGKDLASPTVDFSKDQQIAFAVESLTGRNSSEEDVEIVYAVEDSRGVPVATGSSRSAWNDMWSNDLFVGEVAQTPQTAGTYTLRLYFNGQSVASKEITIQ